MTPERPIDVRFIQGNTGEVITCDLEYAGCEDGQHRWEITNDDVDFDPGRGDSIEIGMLPARTSIAFQSSIMERDGH